MNIKRSILLRVRIAFLVVVLFAFAVVWKIVKIQFVEGEKWRKKAEEIGLRYMEVKAARGNILSDNGSLLATSLPFFRLAFDPTIAGENKFKNKIDSLSMKLANFFDDHTAKEYRKRISNARMNNRQYLILNHSLINFQEKKNMEEWPIFRLGRLNGGVIFEKVDKRFRPFGGLAFRTIGYVNEKSRGAGLEYSFDKVLSGKNGKALYRKVAGNNWKPLNNEYDIKAEQGNNIKTTLDVNLQDVAENSLNKYVKKHKANYGTVVLMKVKTGEIKAMANLSRNKNNKYVEDYNYSFGSQGSMNPGSTFKLASMMALFEETEMKLSDTINTFDGTYKFSNLTLTDAKPGGYGNIDIQTAFEKSSNIGVARLINKTFKHNPERYIKYLSKFHLDQPLGFQMKGEAVPFVNKPSKESWSGISLPWMSIGYEVKLSPLHILTLYNAVANDGKMIKPFIVEKVKHSGNVIKKYTPTVLKEKICSDEALNKVQKLLKGVVKRGTAHNINSYDYQIAGKTGTSQKLINGRYTQRYTTSFVGYFPADDPKYSCIVVIDNPKGVNQYGSDVAAPIFKNIADKIYAQDPKMHKLLAKKEKVEELPYIKAGNMNSLFKISREVDLPVEKKQSWQWVEPVYGEDTIQWQKRDYSKHKVPDVKGYALRDALYVLENQDLKVRYDGYGRVTTQSIKPGQRVLPGSYIWLELNH